MLEPLVGLSRVLARWTKIDYETSRSRELVLGDLGKTYAFAFITQGYLVPLLRHVPQTMPDMILCLIGFAYHMIMIAKPKVTQR